MFKRLKLIRKLLTGEKVARHITGLFTSSMIVALQADGSIDRKLMSDDFVMGYIYGGIAICLEALQVRDIAEKGFAVQQVFEHLFPGNGQFATEICNRKEMQDDPEFQRATRIGYGEMIEVFNSKGQKIPYSLLDHVSRIYEA